MSVGNEVKFQFTSARSSSVSRLTNPCRNIFQVKHKLVVVIAIMLVMMTTTTMMMMMMTTMMTNGNNNCWAGGKGKSWQPCLQMFVGRSLLLGMADTSSVHTSQNVNKMFVGRSLLLARCAWDGQH